MDDKLNKELDDWATQHKSHMENVDQRRASELLKSQLEEYQYELEQKRQRAQTGYTQKRHELSVSVPVAYGIRQVSLLTLFDV